MSARVDGLVRANLEPLLAVLMLSCDSGKELKSGKSSQMLK